MNLIKNLLYSINRELNLAVLSGYVLNSDTEVVIHRIRRMFFNEYMPVLISFLTFIVKSIVALQRFFELL